MKTIEICAMISSNKKLLRQMKTAAKRDRRPLEKDGKIIGKYEGCRIKGNNLYLTISGISDEIYDEHFRQSAVPFFSPSIAAVVN